METLVVEATSKKFGPSFVVDGVWHVADKKANPDLSPIKPGDTIEVDRNGKWVKSFKILSSGEAPKTSPKPQGSRTEAPKAGKADFRTPEQIIRCEATSAVLESPAIAQLIKDKDLSEGFQILTDMVKKTTNYISEGEWK